MADPLPADIGAGSLPRDEICPHCEHNHLWLACDWCCCDEHIRNGID